MASDQIITINPATGTELARYDAMTAEDIDGVLDAGHRGPEARGLPPPSMTAPRSCCGRRRDPAHRSAELGAIATAEMGKPITEAVAEVEKCAWVCEYYADMSPKVLADEDVQATGSRSWVRYEPLGTVLAIMPWNYPYWQVFRFVAPTLMAGNAGILKHSPERHRRRPGHREDARATPGCPTACSAPWSSPRPDVPTTVDGLIQDDRIAAVTLTGSNRAGSHVAASAGRAAKKSVLELGGSDPFVVLADADLDVVVPKAVAGRFLNTGQSCLCAKRFIVHESIAEEFGRRFADAVDELVIGDPSERATKIGPLARADLAANLDRAGRRVRRGRGQGPHRRRPARPRTGLVRPDRPRRRHPRHAGDGRGDLRTGRRRHRVHHRRRGRRAGQRHAVRARRQRLVRRRGARPRRRLAASTPAPCSSTPSPPPTPACRSAASSRAATAASSARPAPREFTNVRTVLVG